MVSMFCKLCFIGICHSLIKEKNLVYLFSEKNINCLVMLGTVPTV
jgi:hypothetical protein